MAAVLQSGEYESPYLEPLPYADPLAGRGSILAGVLCWPGLLKLPGLEVEQRADSGGRGAGAGDAAAALEGSDALQLRHREEVLALLQVGRGSDFRAGRGAAAWEEGQRPHGRRGSEAIRRIRWVLVLDKRTCCCCWDLGGDGRCV